MTERLNIQLLGSMTVMRGSKPVTGLVTRKAEALLAYLVMQKRPFPRELLADLLWDDRSQEQALANLRSLLSSLRRKLKPYLIVTRQTIAFNHESDYWLDVAAFEAGLEIGDQKLTTNLQSPISNLSEVISLYHDDFLAGFHIREAHRFEEWAILQRERLRRLAAMALRRLADDSLRNGRYPQGIDYVNRLISLDNLNERAHRQKMLLLARSGQRNAALQQYEACRQILSEELGVEPAAATTELFTRLRGLTFPPPYNLPPPPSPFVGRSVEMADVRRHLLNPAERLVTLVGPGGIGKTRLALETARRMVQEQPGQFFDGVFYAPLAAVTAVQQLPNQIAHAIGFAFQGSEPRGAQLVNHLRDKEALLILDNYEQFLGADDACAALIAAILRDAPHVTLLVTSRERLNLYEEAVFETHGLHVPPPDAEEPEQYTAVKLFMQRVARLRRDCRPSPNELASIVRSCRLLDGAPLAIELAAGWTRRHSFAEIEAEIAASFDFLQTNFRNVPARQRSMRAVFDHSWQLLTAQEQAVFARLAVFPDSFTLAAAQAVVANLSDEGLIMALADKSLLEREPDGRYQIHPLLRQYAREKLGAEEALATAVAQRHSAYYLTFIEQMESGESLPERAAIEKELPNVTAVWQRAVRSQAFADLDRIIPTLQNFYNIQSWFQEGIDLFQFALDQLGEAADAAQAQTVCDLWARKARLHIHIGQMRQAETALAQAAAALGRVDDPERRSLILSYLSMTNFYAGRYDEAIRLLHEALPLALQADDMDGIAFSYNFLGSCYKAKGDYAQANASFKQSLDAYRQLGDEVGAGIALHNLGNLAQAMGEFERSLAYYRQCNALFKATDYTQGVATASANAGRLALQMENYAEAEKLLAEALRLKEQIHDERGMAVALVGLGAVAAETGRLAAAREHLARGLALAQQSGDVKTTLEGVGVTAVYAHRLHQSQTAAQLAAYILNYPMAAQEVRQQAEKLASELELTAVPPSKELDELATELLAGLLAGE